ncbi:RDD family protein [Corallococcus sp. H22C18031201]|nr:RDD family protein [Corallococcus sp. H22C18031201]
MSLDPLNDASPEGARCALHEDVLAIAICSRCGSYACAECKRPGYDASIYCVGCAPTHQLAERGTRFAANLIDQIVVYAPILVLGILGGMFEDEDSAAVPLILLGILGTLGALVFQCVRVHQSGQSIGKRMMRIKVVRLDGSRADTARIIVLRNVIPTLVGSFCSVLSIVDPMFIFGNDRRCLHDLMADTIVVNVDE